MGLIEVEGAKPGKAPGVGSRLTGQLDEVHGGLLRGWAADLAAPHTTVEIEVVVAGSVVLRTTAHHLRSDLADRGFGTGHHGFCVAMPVIEDAGEPVEVTVRFAATVAPLENGVRTLTPAEFRRPEIQGQLTDVSGGVLVGYVYIAGARSARVPIDLVADGKVLASSWAVDPALDAQLASKGATVFRLSGSNPTWLSLVQSETHIEAAGVRLPMLMSADEFARGMAVVECVIDGRGWLTGSPEVPYPLDTTGMLVAVGNHELIWRCRPVIDDGRTRMEINLPLPSDLAIGAQAVRILFPGSRRQLGPDVVVHHIPRDNIVRNPVFTRWNGDRPAEWSIPADGVTTVTASYGGGAGSAAGEVALSIELDKSNAARLKDLAPPPGQHSARILEQAHERVEFDSSMEVDGLVWARADRAGRLEMQIEVEGDDGSREVLTQMASVWSDWAPLKFRFRIPAVAATYRLKTVALARVHHSFNRIDVAAVGLGFEGFTMVAAREVGARWLGTPPTDGKPTNAVVNGRFSSWSNGLSFESLPTRLDVADGWRIITHKPEPNVSVWAERLSLRDPALAIHGSFSHGIAIAGTLTGTFLRLETVLRAHELLAGEGPLRLRFYAGQDSNSVAAGGVASRIVLAQLVCSQVRPGMPPVERSRHVLVRSLWLYPVGRYFDVSIPDKVLKALRDDLVRALDDMTIEFTLVFEFRSTAAAVIGDVELSALEEEDRGFGESEQAGLGIVALEDRNIAEQVPLLKGIESWLSPRISSAPTPNVGALREPVRGAMSPRWQHSSIRLPSIDIVICVHNALDDVIACLESLERHTLVPHTVTLVDDASDAPVRFALEAFVRYRPWMTLIVHAENKGYTHAANVGMARSRADWVVLLNSDTIVTPGWLEGLFECARSDKRIAFVGPVSNAASWQSVPEVHVQGGWSINPLPSGTTIEQMAELVARCSRRGFPRVPILNGFCTLMRKDALEAVGYLDEISFPMGYGEENDLCVRARKAGYELAVADHVYVYHRKSASFGTKRRTELAKLGTQRFKEKHPEIDVQELQRPLSECVPLIELRQALLSDLQGTAAAQPAEARAKTNGAHAR